MMTVSSYRYLKKRVNINYNIFFFYSADVTIGFLPVDYTVNENEGSVTLSVQLLNGELARNIKVEFSTRDSTATSSAPADYIAPRVSITLQFTPAESTQSVVVQIVDDDITELSETFFGLLSTIDSAVYLDPSTANVEIVDNDGELVICQLDDMC